MEQWGGGGSLGGPAHARPRPLNTGGSGRTGTTAPGTAAAPTMTGEGESGRRRCCCSQDAPGELGGPYIPGTRGSPFPTTILGRSPLLWVPGVSAPT